jgi:hypothetical protein
MSSLNIQIAPSTIKTQVKNHLSIIGRRVKDNTGKSLYSSIQLTTNEDNIVETYMDGAIDFLVGQLADVVTITLINGSYNVTFANSRWTGGVNKADFTPSFNDAFTRFVVAYTVSQVLSMYAPEYAKKYDADASNVLVTLKQLVFTKQPPDSAYTEPSGSCE